MTSRFARRMLRDVHGYTPGEQPRVSGLIKLNTNENPYPPSPKVFEALAALTPDQIKNYPDPVSRNLREACAERYGYPDESWVIAGNGMDEVLAMIIRTFSDPGDTVLSAAPTYTLYEVLANLHGAKYRALELDDAFQLPEDVYSADARLVFVTYPNAPSGIAPGRAAMERLCREFKGLVIIDEAYADFAESNCVDFPKRFDNVIVTRTFSKSFSLCGLRLGIGIANPEIIQEFLKTKDSYNLNAATQTAGLAAILDYDWMLDNAAKVKATRQRVTDELRALDFTVPQSEANFVLASRDGRPDTKTLFTGLRERNILVRYFETPRLHNAMRISIGTDEQMDTVLAALRELLAH